MADKTKKKSEFVRPTAEQIEAEIRRTDRKTRFGSLVRSTFYALVTVAAAAVLLSTLLMPVLKIYGNSMSPTLDEGEIVVAVKTSRFEQGDVLAFYYNNRVLVKRVIGGPGDWVDIDQEGVVKVNGVLLDEPYLIDRSFETCDIQLPYQVPDGQYFVMGDHRSTSIDSRTTAVGCVSAEQVVGRILFCVWPLGELRTIS